MDTMDVNKMIAAILVAGIAYTVAGMIGRSVVHEEPLKQPAIKIEGMPAAAPAPEAAKPAGPHVPPIAALLASADPAEGQKIVQKDCSICHTFNKGGEPKVGPNLYGIVGAKRAHESGFNYSEGLAKLGGTWTYENLNEWIDDPHAVVPDTRMAFAGIKNDKQRADVIAYLRTLSDHPEPLPSPTAAETKAQPAQTAAAAPAPAAETAKPAGPEIPAIEPYLANADVAVGKQKVESLCGICHSFNKGGAPKIGPNLYDIVNAKRAHEAGFAYSEGLAKLGGTWTYENLNHWIYDPRAVVPDTKMIFPGIKNTKERADVIAYLRTLSDHPAPLPAASGAAAK
ncbi:MAG: c-type cytochrome [Acidobacteriia bacterium]|nr:c-type cytochrome [Methyloceanibacter sp.]MBX5472015.1 c-type cytochrome [Acetobacteraceae bacterium]MCL6490699.1 c-type cytochrome [Terriglobia bacterium]